MDCVRGPRRCVPPGPGGGPHRADGFHPRSAGPFRPPTRGRRLPRAPGHPPGRDARRRSRHRLVQRLQQPATALLPAFSNAATALLPGFSGARAEGWVCVDFGRTRTFDRAEVSFTLSAIHSLPASVEAAVWDGKRCVPVEGASVAWATAFDEPTVITFDAVRGSRLRLTLASAYPGETRGAVRIARLEVPGS